MILFVLVGVTVLSVAPIAAHSILGSLPAPGTMIEHDGDDNGLFSARLEAVFPDDSDSDDIGLNDDGSVWNVPAARSAAVLADDSDSDDSGSKDSDSDDSGSKDSDSDDTVPAGPSDAVFPDLYVPRTSDKDMTRWLFLFGTVAVLVVLVTVNV